MDDVTEPPRKRPWVANGPEDRLSIAVDRFLNKALDEPFYCCAIPDEDGGRRTKQQRARDANRGRVKGQLDWLVVQGPNGLVRQVELKRGKNTLSESQKLTIIRLAACGAPPIIAYTLREVADGLMKSGFRFRGNYMTTLLHCEHQLEGWDREAEDILSGAVVRKVRTTRAPPRHTMNNATIKRARARGLMI